MELGLGLMGERGLSLEAGVRSAGEAMGSLLEEEQRESVFYRGVCEEATGFLPRRLITLSLFLVLWTRPYPIIVP